MKNNTMVLFFCVVVSMTQILQVASVVEMENHMKQPQWLGKQGFFRERAEDLVSQMALDEKINLYRMDSNGVERLNINPHHWWSEALYG
jgi:hypothetical protein